MTFGIIVNCLSVLIGGIIGSVLGKHINKELKNNLPSIFGISALVIGVTKAPGMKSLTAVVLAVILGYIIGEFIDIQKHIENLSVFVLKKLKLKSSDDALLSIAIVTFCFSGTGIFGVLNEALAQDSSILLSKSVLDFFTSIIFASIVGVPIAFVSVFQIVVFNILYLISFFVGEYIKIHAFDNFLSVGGVLTITVALKLLNVIKIKPINILPAFVLVVLFSVLGI